MQSLINDPAVAKYRQLEIEEGVKWAEELLKGNLSPDTIAGGLHMLKKLLHLPHKWGKDKTSREAAQMMIKRDLKEFHSKYMRLFLE